MSTTKNYTVRCSECGEWFSSSLSGRNADLCSVCIRVQNIDKRAGNVPGHFLGNAILLSFVAIFILPMSNLIQLPSFWNWALLPSLFTFIGLLLWFSYHFSAKSFLFRAILAGCIRAGRQHSEDAALSLAYIHFVVAFFLWIWVVFFYA